MAGGCFWGVQAFFDQLEGVVATTVGYANGKTDSPTYEEVYQDDTGYAETVELIYDVQRLSLAKILDCFFRIIDPCSLNAQGGDSGTRYRTGIYYKDKNEAATIEGYVEGIRANYDQPIVTELLPLENYYPAEEYHQKYLKKNPQGYCHIDLNLIYKE